MRSSVRSPIQDKFLISSQPGFKILAITCAICFALGMSIRGVLHTTRITRQVALAAKQINQNLHIEFAGAELSLADGVIPRLAVLVHRIQMGGAIPCYPDVRVKVDELELPISLYQVIRGRGPIHRLFANKIDVDLGERDQNCQSHQANLGSPKEGELAHIVENLPVAERTPAAKAVASIVKVSGDLSAVNGPSQTLPSNEVDVVVVDEMNIRIPGWRQSLVLSQIQVNVKDQESKSIVLKSQVGFGGDQPFIDYLNQANLLINYQKLPDEKVSAHIFGHWREGYYSIIGNCRLEDEICILESQLNSISISQAIVTAEKLGLIKETIKLKPWWLSARVQSKIHFRKMNETVSEITDLRLDGEAGKIQSDHITFAIDKLQPIRPFTIDVDQVRLDTLVPQSRTREVGKYFESLGKLTGKINVVSLDEYRFVGNVSDLGVYFANKGERVSQQFQNLSTEISVSKPKVKVTVTAIEPRQGSWRGYVKLQSNTELTDGSLDLLAEELQFSPAVVDLFTRGGKMSQLMLSFNGKWKDREWSQVQGELQIPDLLVEGHELKNLGIKLKGDLDWNFGVNAQSWMVDQKFSEFLFSHPDLKNLSFGNLENFKARIKFQSPSTLSWSQVSAKSDSGDSWSSKGGWTNEGNLGGVLTLKSRDRNPTRRMMLSGTRDEPKIIPNAD
jgi:hypothetical protein